MQRLVLALGVAVLAGAAGLAGCAQTDQQLADSVCTTLCECVETSGVPSLVQACVDNQCLPELIRPVADACATCVTDHEASCSALIADCPDMCFQAPTNRKGL